jgi:hypothetical protein
MSEVFPYRDFGQAVCVSAWLLRCPILAFIADIVASLTPCVTGRRDSIGLRSRHSVQFIRE